MVSLQEGQRCYCDGFFATVRFVGEVPPTKGESEHTYDGVTDKIRPPSWIQGFGWEWNGMIPHEANTMEQRTEFVISRAGIIIIICYKNYDNT